MTEQVTGVEKEREPMRAAGFVGSAAIAVMAIAIGWAARTGDFGRDFAVVASRPWGLVGLIDLYVGLFVAGAWIWWRERSPVRRAGWLAALVFGGNLTLGLYVLVAARSARRAGDPRAFFTGK